MAETPLVYSLGDVIDKMSILVRKIKFGEEHAATELTYLEDGLDSYLDIPGKFITAVMRLAQANFDIWNLENELRKGGEDKFSLEEIGRRALAIRDINKKRVQYKNEITVLMDSGFIEQKTKHRSQ